MASTVLLCRLVHPSSEKNCCYDLKMVRTSDPFVFLKSCIVTTVQNAKASNRCDTSLTGGQI